MRTSRFPSFAVSAMLHIVLFMAAYITWPLWSKKMELSQDAVPITIVASAPTADIRPAEKAPEAQSATTPDPEPTAEPAPPAPEPAPQPKPAPPPPSPPAPAPKPKPISQPVAKPTPTPSPPAPKSQPAPKAKPQALNLDQLAAAPATKAAKPAPRSSALDLTALAASPKGAKSNAPKGPARPETDLLARLAVGRATGLSGDVKSALQAKVIPLWHIRGSCDAEGATTIIIQIGMRLAPDGALIGEPIIVSKTGSKATGDTINAFAQRAMFAVEQAAPYTEIPRDGPHEITLNFNAKSACQGM